MRLAIAFGARGRSGALAHYEPGRQVINLTKMKGAGSLAHEWGHALDHSLGTMLKCRTYLSVTSLEGGYYAHNVNGVLQESNNGDIFDAMRALMKRAQYVNLDKDGLTQWYIRELSKNKAQAVYELKHYKDHYWAAPDYTKNGKTPPAWLEGKDIQDVYDTLIKDIASIGITSEDQDYERQFRNLYYASDERSRAIDLVRDICTCIRKIEALANLLRQLVEDRMSPEKFEIERVKKSKFYADATALDQGKAKPYYSSGQEMFARMFECYVENELKKRNYQSQYLVSGTLINDVYKSLGMGSPYPQDEDLEDLSVLMGKLIDTIRERIRMEQPNNYQFERGLMHFYETDTRDDTYAGIKKTKRDIVKAAEEAYGEGGGGRKQFKQEVQRIAQEANGQAKPQAPVKPAQPTNVTNGTNGTAPSGPVTTGNTVTTGQTSVGAAAFRINTKGMGVRQQLFAIASSDCKTVNGIHPVQQMCKVARLVPMVSDSIKGIPDDGFPVHGTKLYEMHNNEVHVPKQLLPLWQQYAVAEAAIRHVMWPKISKELTSGLMGKMILDGIIYVQLAHIGATKPMPFIAVPNGCVEGDAYEQLQQNPANLASYLELVRKYNKKFETKLWG